MDKRKIAKLDMHQNFESFMEMSITAFGEGINRSKEMHQWLFDENYYNIDAENMMFVLEEDDKVIGADGLVPFEFYINGRIVKAAYSVKSATHPEYQRQGIFKIMTENSMNKGKEAGIDIIIGLANKNSYPAYQKFGWPTIFEKEVYIRPLAITNYVHKVTKMPRLSKICNDFYQIYINMRLAASKRILDNNIAVEVLDLVPPEVDNCWNMYKSKFNVLTVRDFKYLDYRYNKRPDVSYKTIAVNKDGQLVGYAVIRIANTKTSTVAWVMEIFTDPENESLIAALGYNTIEFCRKNKVDYIIASTGLWGQFKNVLFKLGFQYTKQKPSNNMMIAKILNSSIDLDEIMGHDKWFLTQGDGDVEVDL